MYLSYYKLSTKPFQISTDPKFLWMGEKHKEALAVLKYGILDNKGFLLLTGDVGTGKTTLINTLIESLGDDVIVAMVQDPGLGKIDFFNFVAASFHMNQKFNTKGEFLIHLSEFLHQAFENNKKVLLVVDEAQRLSQMLLEEIRLLSNIEVHSQKLINIFFVGQAEFNDIILKKQNRAIRQRITINFSVEPLNLQETEKYIRFRMRVANAQKQIFALSAIREIYAFSKGYPRLINIICDLALLTGYVQDQKIIKSDIIKECAQELQINHYSPQEFQKNVDKIQTAMQSPVNPREFENTNEKTNEKTEKKYLYLIILILLAIWIIIAGYLYFNNYSLGSLFQNKSIIRQSVNQDIRYQENGLQSDESDRPDIKNGKKDEKSLQFEDLTGLGKNSRRQIAGNVDSKNISQKNFISRNVSKTLSRNKTAKQDKNLNNKIDETLKLIEVNDEKENIQANILISDQAEEQISIVEFFENKLVIRFDFDSNIIRRDALLSLNRLAYLLIQESDAGIIIKGYTDSMGIYSYNIKLAEFRANIVRTYLLGRGVNPDQILTIGMGPVNTGEPESNQAYRKVEIELGE